MGRRYSELACAVQRSDPIRHPLRCDAQPLNTQTSKERRDLVVAVPSRTAANTRQPIRSVWMCVRPKHEALNVLGDDSQWQHFQRMTLGWYSVACGKRTFADTALRAVAFGGDQRSTSSVTPRQVAPKNKQSAFVHSAWRYIAVSM